MAKSAMRPRLRPVRHAEQASELRTTVRSSRCGMGPRSCCGRWRGTAAWLQTPAMRRRALARDSGVPDA
eukprot:2964930-Prymnesium_polylepis.1